MSRLDEMIPENEDKLAWLLGVPRGGLLQIPRQSVQG